MNVINLCFDSRLFGIDVIFTKLGTWHLIMFLTLFSRVNNLLFEHISWRDQLFPALLSSSLAMLVLPTRTGAYEDTHRRRRKIRRN